MSPLLPAACVIALTCVACGRAIAVVCSPCVAEALQPLARVVCPYVGCRAPNAPTFVPGPILAVAIFYAPIPHGARFT